MVHKWVLNQIIRAKFGDLRLFCRPSNQFQGAILRFSRHELAYVCKSTFINDLKYKNIERDFVFTAALPFKPKIIFSVTAQRNPITRKGCNENFSYSYFMYPGYILTNKTISLQYCMILPEKKTIVRSHYSQLCLTIFKVCVTFSSYVSLTIFKLCLTIFKVCEII